MHLFKSRYAYSTWLIWEGNRNFILFFYFCLAGKTGLNKRCKLYIIPVIYLDWASVKSIRKVNIQSILSSWINLLLLKVSINCINSVVFSNFYGKCWCGNFLSQKQYLLLTWWNVQRSCFFSSCPSLTSVSRTNIFAWMACSLYEIFSSSSATCNSNERELM